MPAETVAPISYWEEIKRKGIHLSSLWMVVAVTVIPDWRITAALFGDERAPPLGKKGIRPFPNAARGSPRAYLRLCIIFRTDGAHRFIKKAQSFFPVSARHLTNFHGRQPR